MVWIFLLTFPNIMKNVGTEFKWLSWAPAAWLMKMTASWLGVSNRFHFYWCLVVFFCAKLNLIKNLQQNNVKQKQLTYSKKVFIMETWGESIWKAFQPIFWTFHHFCPTNKKTKMASRFHLSHKCQANPVVFELTSENSLLAFPLCLLF